MSTLNISKELKTELANAIKAYGSILYSATLGIATAEFDWASVFKWVQVLSSTLKNGHPSGVRLLVRMTGLEPARSRVGT